MQKLQQKHVNCCYLHGKNFISICINKECEEKFLCQACLEEHQQSHLKDVVNLKDLEKDGFKDLCLYQDFEREPLKETRQFMFEMGCQIEKQIEEIVQQETKKLKKSYQNQQNQSLDIEISKIEKMIRDIEDFENQMAQQDEIQLQQVGAIINYTNSQQFQDRMGQFLLNKEYFAQDQEKNVIKILEKNKNKQIQQKQVYEIIKVDQICEALGINEIFENQTENEQQIEIEEILQEKIQTENQNQEDFSSKEFIEKEIEKNQLGQDFINIQSIKNENLKKKNSILNNNTNKKPIYNDQNNQIQNEYSLRKRNSAK